MVSAYPLWDPTLAAYLSDTEAYGPRKTHNPCEVVGSLETCKAHPAASRTADELVCPCPCRRVAERRALCNELMCSFWLVSRSVLAGTEAVPCFA